MIVGKLYCSLVQAWESILAPFPKSAHHKMNQNSANAPQNDSCSPVSKHRECSLDVHRSISNLHPPKVSLTASRKIRGLMETMPGDCCSGTTQVCISMHCNFRYKNQHLQAELTMKLKLLHFRRINKTFKGNSCWISQEYSEALIVAHWNRN